MTTCNQLAYAFCNQNNVSIFRVGDRGIIRIQSGSEIVLLIDEKNSLFKLGDFILTESLKRICNKTFATLTINCRITTVGCHVTQMAKHSIVCFNDEKIPYNNVRCKWVNYAKVPLQHK